MKQIFLTYIGSTILPVLKYIITLFGLFSVFLNLYVILILASTQRYKLMIPHIDFNGNYCIGIFLLVFLATMLVFVFQFRNLILSFVANSMLFTVANFIYTSLNGHADDFGVVVKNRFFQVLYNFTLEEKLAWISRLEKELNTKINVNSNFLDNVYSYKECKTRVSQLFEEEKRQALLKAQESGGLFSSLGHWIVDHKTLVLGTLIVIGGLGYIYYKGYLFSGILENLKKSGEAHEETGKTIVKMASEMRAGKEKMIILAEQLKQQVMKTDILSNKLSNITNNQQNLDSAINDITGHMQALQIWSEKIGKQMLELMTKTSEMPMQNRITNVRDLENLLGEQQMKLSTFTKVLEALGHSVEKKQAIITQGQLILKTAIEKLDLNVRAVLTEHAERIEYLEKELSVHKMLDKVSDMVDKGSETLL